MNIQNRSQYRIGGFSMVELLIVVVIIGILAAAAVPRFNFAGVTAKREERFVRVLTADLRKTRLMAIANAADNPNGFQLRITASSPRKVEIRNIPNNQVIETHPVESGLTITGTTQFTFTPFGAMNPPANVQMTIAGQNKTWVLDVYGGTGSVQCTEH